MVGRYRGTSTIANCHGSTTYRGTLAIHAAKHIEKDACEDFGYDWRTIPSGAILCIVGVQGCVRFPHPLAPPDEYGDFEEGRYGIFGGNLLLFILLGLLGWRAFGPPLQ